MTNRLPLTLNSNTEQIQELQVGENLDIGDGDIVNIRSLVGNTLTAGSVTIAGTLSVGSIANVESITGNVITGNTIQVSTFSSDSIILSGSANIAGNLLVSTAMTANTLTSTATLSGHDSCFLK